MRYALEIAYDGTDFAGWQVQKNGYTVQQAMENAARSLFSAQCKVTASGRTDSGVHAAGQVCHIDCETTIPAEKIADAFNTLLPPSVRVLKSTLAPAGFDANRSAKKKTYVYRAYYSPRQNPLADRYAVWLKTRPDLQKMQYICSLFEGEHDFKAYCASNSSVKTTVRTLYSVKVESEQSPLGQIYTLRVTGNGFLYNMVRTLAGTAIGFAQGALSEQSVRRTLTDCDRKCVGKTMPPQGLILLNVDYGCEIF